VRKGSRGWIGETNNIHIKENKMDWRKPTKKENGLRKIPENWLYLEYYESLSILFRIENALRTFVYIVLKNESKEKWTETNITTDDSGNGTIANIAKKKIAQAKDFGYLGYILSCPLMHLSTGELIRLITSTSCWPLFKCYFPCSLQVVKLKLDEISSVRNSIAHFRPIKDGDVDLIKQNAKHVLTTIEYVLSDILHCYDTVPSNTIDDWYKSLKSLGSDVAKFGFFQSNDKDWVEIRMTFFCPIIEQSNYDDYISYNILNIISPSILERSSQLTQNLIFLSEYIPFIKIPDSTAPAVRKMLCMVFSRRTLELNHALIKTEFENILNNISEEINLIKKDNLARGKIIAPTRIFASFINNGWILRSKAMECNIKEVDPPEYWGPFSFGGDNFISDTNKFPWMPTEISDTFLPF
jgi:hypothetical protein